MFVRIIDQGAKRLEPPLRLPYTQTLILVTLRFKTNVYVREVRGVKHKTNWKASRIYILSLGGLSKRYGTNTSSSLLFKA